MATAHVTSSGSPGFDEDQFATFRKDFKGSLIQPEDPEYDRAKKIWNGSIDKRPLIIARCQEIADVVLAVRFARKHNLLMAIRGGGHNVGGRALCDEGLGVDLPEMRGVSVDRLAILSPPPRPACSPA